MISNCKLFSFSWTNKSLGSSNGGGGGGGSAYQCMFHIHRHVWPIISCASIEAMQVHPLINNIIINQIYNNSGVVEQMLARAVLVFVLNYTPTSPS